MEMKTKIWRNDAGQYHRLGGPALITPNGNRYWYVNGERHRLDGPAVVVIDDTGEYKIWFVNGKHHRIDGPAIIWLNGTQKWYLNGQHHRADGRPAVICPDGTQKWWINGVEITSNFYNWIDQYNISEDYTKWTGHRVLFRLSF